MWLWESAPVIVFVAVFVALLLWAKKSMEDYEE